MTQTSQALISTIGIDIGKNSFHVIGFDERGAIVLRQKLSRNRIAVRFANLRRCLIGMEACVGAHHLSRRLQSFGHDVRIMPALYVKPYLKGQKNDFRDAEAIAEAVQRPTMRFVPTKNGAVRFTSATSFAHPSGPPTHSGDQSDPGVSPGTRNCRSPGSQSVAPSAARGSGQARR